MNLHFVGFRWLVLPIAAASLVADMRGSDAQGKPATQSASAETSPPAPPQPTDLPAPVLDPFADKDAKADASSDPPYEPLLRGPVHEAFASPTDADPATDGRAVPKAPPPTVDEQPPEAGDEAEGMDWIPGYWSWSDEENDYVWVSGLWRRVPPGRSWVAGRWNKTAAGYRWTQGYWSGAAVSSTAATYLPSPPASIDNGPSVPPPGEDYFWVPGHWQYAGSGYQWQGGFWSVQQNNWVWQPSSYVSTPSGCLWVDGYWDYLPTTRGCLYAPVRFYDSVYLQPSYIYRPRYPLLGTAALLLQLFVRPGYSHYYYGNYYGSSYAGRGYRPWYDVGYGRGNRTPWHSYYDWQYHKSGIDFAHSMNRYGKSVRAQVNSPSLGRDKHLSTTRDRGARAVTSPIQNGDRVPGGGVPGGRDVRTLDSVVRSSLIRVDTARRIGGANRIDSAVRLDPSNRSRSSRGDSGAGVNGGPTIRSGSSGPTRFSGVTPTGQSARGPSLRSENSPGLRMKGSASARPMSSGLSSRGFNAAGSIRGTSPATGSTSATLRGIDRGVGRTYPSAPSTIGRSVRSPGSGSSSPNLSLQPRSSSRLSIQSPSPSFNSRSIRPAPSPSFNSRSIRSAPSPSFRSPSIRSTPSAGIRGASPSRGRSSSGGLGGFSARGGAGFGGGAGGRGRGRK